MRLISDKLTQQEREAYVRLVNLTRALGRIPTAAEIAAAEAAR